MRCHSHIISTGNPTVALHLFRLVALLYIVVDRPDHEHHMVGVGFHSVGRQRSTLSATVTTEASDGGIEM